MSGEAVCPYCRAPFETEDEVKACPVCGTLHHADCFAENGGCTIFGCAAAPAEEPKVLVGAVDFQPAPVAAPVYRRMYGDSIYSLNQPGPVVPVQGPAGTPPPPMPLGTQAAPPPRMVAPAAAFPVYGYGAYVKPKSRVAYVLLAVFLGSLGVHNFYAGYNKKATIQLLITLFTCFWASLITWIWAIVEACTITMDDDGVPLS